MLWHVYSSAPGEDAPLPEAPTLSLLDLQLPEATSWWPPAPGWWLVLSLLPVLLLTLRHCRQWRNRPRARQFRVAALAELEQYYQHYQHSQHRQDDRQHSADTNSPEAIVFIQQVSALLKRVTLIQHDPARVARLSGEGWADFLTQDQSEPCQREIRALLSAGYSARQTRVDVEPLYHFARRWIASKEAFPG